MFIFETYRCKEVVPTCSFVVNASSRDEVMVQVVRHIADDHHVHEITPEIAEVVRRAVHESVFEDSPSFAQIQVGQLL